ncbi:MAG: CBS domain-containing protein, partial [Chloroflexi bacterium]|nr:CBS domain-containing protein [Chloroflexota bacterium]
RPVISITKGMPIHDVLVLFKQERIRRAPVIEAGKLIGIVSDKDLLNASPSPVSSLSVWEMNYLLSKITIKNVMTRKVITVDMDTPIEDAARIMADNKIGGLPVMKDKLVVGMITETDLFKIFLELMGARERAVRITSVIDDAPGQLAKITKAIADEGGNFVSFGQFVSKDPGTRILTFKVDGIKKENVKKILEKTVKKLVDIR